MLIASERHLATVLREYCAHYNEERPHRSLALVPPSGAAEPLRQQTTDISRRARLGGLLNAYSMAA
jgi:hypothetical protein